MEKREQRLLEVRKRTEMIWGRGEDRIGEILEERRGRYGCEGKRGG